MIGPNTAIAASLVVTMLAAAVSFGVMYQKVTAVGEAVKPIPQMQQDIAVIKNSLGLKQAMSSK